MTCLWWKDNPHVVKFSVASENFPKTKFSQEQTMWTMNPYYELENSATWTKIQVLKSIPYSDGVWRWGLPVGVMRQERQAAWGREGLGWLPLPPLPFQIRTLLIWFMASNTPQAHPLSPWLDTLHLSPPLPPSHFPGARNSWDKQKPYRTELAAMLTYRAVLKPLRPPDHHDSLKKTKERDSIWWRKDRDELRFALS